MKEFDLEAAKAGKPVCTRDGRAARIICWDMKDTGGLLRTPIVALINIDGSEVVRCYDEHGIDPISSNSADDLMMTSEKKEGWVNLYKKIDVYSSNTIYATKNEAYGVGRVSQNYLTTIKIEWEE